MAPLSVAIHPFCLGPQKEPKAAQPPMADKASANGDDCLVPKSAEGILATSGSKLSTRG